MIAFALVVACLSLVGIPPLAGFMSKWQVLAAGLETENKDIGLLMVFVALNSVFSLAYYLPIVNALFRPEIHLPARSLPITMRLPIVILTGAIIILGIYPGILDSLLIPAGQSLMRLFGG
jgi:NADH:ubiquinone oxidoreductase subunit 2 (subunit N)